MTYPSAPQAQDGAWRQAGWLLLAGGILAAASTALHPVTLDPGDATAVLDAVRRAPGRWIAVHVALGVGVTAWSLGWFAVWQGLQAAGRARWSGAGAMLAVASLAVWIPLLALEAAGLPLLARATVPGRSPLWWSVAWPATLAGGYAATWLYWLAGIAAAWDLAAGPAARGAPHPPGHAARQPGPAVPAGGDPACDGRPDPGPRMPLGLSLAALLPGLPGMALAWFWPAAAAPVLLVSLIPGALWALALAWRMATGRT
ncbi:hypothetical protein Tmar_2018 [Thermaerobacter marianensis DSM 12885]|uniref:Uncharacterized protein n=1 Tax=Thermaerobacter marianensis (strain ATCC 700841 / DSM 12885 / JCM 10246 / 7p75a) TaxID=644966 RepID=E6SJ75_THEM7|nr:hypothetical protein [Thermaerobacter marianensis]ADU52099.1 hypothetical protein Tmar_2018 [Thermaerobacter marianensis DSM 12885]